MGERILYGREEDLGYNQAGRLSPRQAKLTAQPLRWAAVTVALSAPISLLLAFGIPRLLSLSDQSSTMLITVFCVAAVVELVIAAWIWRGAARAATRQVEIVEGCFDHLPARPEAQLPARLKLGGRMITIPKSRMPLRHDVRYRAYGLAIPRRNLLMTYLFTEIEEAG